MKLSSFTLVAYILSLGLPVYFFYLFVLKPKGLHLDLKFHNFSGGTAFLSLVMMFGMMLISEFFTSLIPTSGTFFGWLYAEFMKQMNTIGMDNFTMILMVVVCAPILEEILFRGIILKAFLNRGFSPKKSIIFSALIFGAIHGYPWQFVGAFFLGLVLGLIYYKTKSLIIPMFLHAFNNLVAALLLIFNKEQSFTEAAKAPSYVILVIGAILFGASYYFFMQRKTLTTE